MRWRARKQLGSTLVDRITAAEGALQREEKFR